MTKTKQNPNDYRARLTYAGRTAKELLELESADYKSDPKRGRLVCTKVRTEWMRRENYYRAGLTYAAMRYWQGFIDGQEHG